VTTYLRVNCVEGGYFVARIEMVERAVNQMRRSNETPELQAMRDMARKLSGIAPEGNA
jgi:hypothetical protein